MSIRIALAGNPNSGKTTMFNALTGSNQYVGNWPGVTVEKKEGRMKGHKDVVLVDLPGIYSLSPYTLEEVVSRKYLLEERPDAMINIVDATNIERNLYLTTQLLELGIPTVIALNMMDMVEKRGDTINVEELSEKLGCIVLETSALREKGIKEVIDQAVMLAKGNKRFVPLHEFSTDMESTISRISDLLSDHVAAENLRWYSIKFFERDEEVLASVTLPKDVVDQIEAITVDIEDAHDDDSESIITNERYQYISSACKGSFKKEGSDKLSSSDKIDKIVTNQWLALPIFAVVMFVVYYLAIATVGTGLTDWVNETLFGDWITNGALSLLSSIGANEIITSLVVDGIIGGVGAVLGFLPQMMVLFFLLAILEDSGYMARIAFIMDKIFRRFGLSGKSFIPMLVTTGCGVPGIMASRTIESERDRRMTVMTTTFVPCGAKLPIIALIAGALFTTSSWWVAPSVYFFGILSVIISGIILKKTKIFQGEPAPFVMELPPYRFPSVKGLLRNMWDKGVSFVKRAGSIIFVSSVIVWFLSNFSWGMQMVDTNESILASLGNIIAPIFAPLGWGNWQATVATITGLIAKENVVATFGVLFGHAEVSEAGEEIWMTLTQFFTPLAGYSFLMFNMFCAPCFAAIGAMKKELGTKWMWISIGYMTTFAYGFALIVYQFGMLFTGGGFRIGTVAAIVVLAAALFLLFRPDPNKKKTKLA